MPIWVCMFDDDEHMLAHRKKWRGEHHAYLRRNSDKILFAGALLADKNSAPTGGLWVLDVAGEDEARTLVQGDPYYDSRHRRFRLQLWKFALEEFDAKLANMALTGDKL